MEEKIISIGYTVAIELKKKYNLLETSAAQIERDINNAIAFGLKLDALLRLPPKESVVDPPKRVTKECHGGAYRKKYKRTPSKTAPEGNIKALDQAELKELKQLRHEISNDNGTSFAGRIITNEFREKIARLKALELKYESII